MTFESQPQPSRKVSVLLGIGIFLLPIIFVWFLLRAGHSTLSRVVGFGWLILSIFIGVAAQGGGSATTAPVQVAASGSPAPDAGTSALQPPSNPRRMPEEPVPQQPAERATTRNEPEATMAEYQAIRPGMSYSEVVAIIGGPGEELSSSDIAGISTVMYQWEGNGFAANMNAMFQDDRMVQKAQFGLR